MEKKEPPPSSLREGRQGPAPSVLGRQGPPPPRSYLHMFSDGSTLRKTTARDFCKISIWEGNRILNEEHKNKIQSQLSSIKSLDLKPFHIVTYPSDEGPKTVIVDGQHRATILKEAFINANTENFDLLVVEKRCESQGEISAYFKLLNNTKAVDYKEDPKMLAEPYVVAVEKAFNAGKKEKQKLVRSGTKRPYMDIDKLRHAIIKRISTISMKTPEQLVEQAMNINREWLAFAIGNPENESQKYITLGFMLAIDDKFEWLNKE